MKMLNLRPTWLKLQPSWLKGRTLPEQLSDVANKLLHPPTSTKDVLLLLDRVEHLLSKVDQSPWEELQKVLCPYVKSLIQELLEHSDNDVRVQVLSCISELTRITAPTLPYDDQMKKIFKLIVLSMGSLSNPSNRSYAKAINILHIVAGCRLFLLMLDLDCDALVVVMFHIFLSTITSEHPQLVFDDMKYIMSTLLEESDIISFELIAPLLVCMEDSTQKATEISKELAREVFGNCSTKLAPYLSRAKLALPEATPGVQLVRETCFREDCSIVLEDRAHNYISNTKHIRDVTCNDIIQPLGLQGDANDEATRQKRSRFFRDDTAFSNKLKQVVRIFDSSENIWKYLVCWTDTPLNSLLGGAREYFCCWKNRPNHLVHDSITRYLVHWLNHPNPRVSFGVWKYLVYSSNHQKILARDGIWKYLVHWKSHSNPILFSTLRSRVFSSRRE